MAYVVNDTGVAAAAFAFGMGAAGLLYLPMMEGPWWEASGNARSSSRKPVRGAGARA